MLKKVYIKIKKNLKKKKKKKKKKLTNWETKVM